MDKLLKEKDKLEMQAMVMRMQERDQQKKLEAKTNQGASSNVIESQNADLAKISKDERDSMIPELRVKAREKYLKDRVEQQMALQKKLLDDQKKLFDSESGGDRA